MILYYLASIPLTLILYLAWYLHVPWDLPSLPRIPFYVSILGLWSSMGQDEIYERWLRKPLEAHGAVLIWFAGRWSILVTRPDLLTDMFRNEDLYAKAGSQKKIPWSVIATLVGDNIINSHGDTWKLYTGIMKPGLQKKNFDTAPLLIKSRRFVDEILAEQDAAGRGTGILVNTYVQQWAVDVMGMSFLDLDLRSLEKPHGAVRLEAIQSVIKLMLFRPLFFNFPDLDQFAWLIKSRQRAYEIMHEFGDTLMAAVLGHIDSDREKGIKPAEEMVVHMLVDAYRDGRLTEKQFKDNLKIVFLTAHENAQQLVNSMFWEIGKNTEVQTRLRGEILSTNTATPTSEVVNALPYLTAVVYELLRLYPPVSQLINRVTVRPAMLGNEIPIPAGTFVGWNAYGVHVNPAIWGPDANEFKPERWGRTVGEMHARFRRETVRGTYIPFNAHSRKCLGQGFVLLQMKILLFEVLRRIEWTVDPGYRLKMTPGGILAPLGCRVILSEVKESETQQRS
ncbi:hypothetical protein CNMCM8927_001161 [Aspergillus lentulus]|uniref:Cytochrome P450-DIT2 n=1 Tax=Aspergillus lentulus TaxID=293939 RepID=A0AAN5YVA8_ASPLE|nr:hypothetical protein CNMCM8927_001161 [Aspergillus lentulus]